MFQIDGKTLGITESFSHSVCVCVCARVDLSKAMEKEMSSY